MEKSLGVLTLCGALLALVCAYFMAKKVLGFSEGTEKMEKIAGYIRTGANAYLKRQYKVVSIFFGVMFLVLVALSAFFSSSSLAKRDARTANACRDGLNSGLKVSFAAGSVMGLSVVGLGLLDISVWFLL